VVYLAVVMCGGGDTGAPDATVEASDGVGLDAVEAGDSGTASEVEAYTRAGSRLRPMYYQGADGSRMARGNFWDSTRGEECSFVLAADGVIRCLPIQGAAQASYQTLHVDTECTSKALVAPSCAAKPRYALEVFGLTDCKNDGNAIRLYAVGAEVPFEALYTNNAPPTYSGCVVAKGNGYDNSPGSAFDGLTFFERGAEIPPTAFIDGTITHD
jgi:hypothetical protein